LIVVGLFKKMVIADTVAMVANQAFSSTPSTGGCLFWWTAAAAFAVQIYCDFSGYSDIACGLSNWMGYEFPVNFNHPYAACGLRDFWGRWHISLSTWFRDYVYIPLGGSHQGAMRSHANLWATMITSGIWHGANWTFVVWGAMHALLLSLERITKWPGRLARWPGGRIVGTIVTTSLVLMSWVFFRAESLEQAFHVLFQMWNVQTLSWSDLELFPRRAVLLTVLCLVAELRFAVLWPAWTSPRVPTRLQPAFAALVLVACVYFRGSPNVFIYFQF